MTLQRVAAIAFLGAAGYLLWQSLQGDDELVDDLGLPDLSSILPAIGFDPSTDDFAAAPATSIDQAGLDFIEGNEGSRLTAYPDASGYSIGFGHFGASPGETITPDQELQLFQGDYTAAENAVDRYVTVPLSQNEYDALVDFVFNAGAGNFHSSQLLQDINAGDFSAADVQFLSQNTHGGSLLSRRQAEAELFG